MSPFDISTMLPPTLAAADVLTNPVLPPVVEDFDPEMESLGFTLSAEDADGGIVLRDMAEGAGCRVEVNGRILVILMGVRADDIGPNALEFTFED